MLNYLQTGVLYHKKRQIRNLMQICLLRLKTGGEGGIRTPGTLLRHTRFPIEHVRPTPSPLQVFFSSSTNRFTLILQKTFAHYCTTQKECNKKLFFQQNFIEQKVLSAQICVMELNINYHNKTSEFYDHKNIFQPPRDKPLSRTMRI